MSNQYIAIVEQFIAKLRQQVQLEIQHNWHDITLLNIVNISNNLARINLEECPIADVNEKGYIVFSQGRQVKWLAQKITIPTALQGYPISGLSLRLVLTWWAEDAQIFINGELVQQGDLFDSSARVPITDNARSQQEYLITVRLVSPNHDIGALMRSHLLYEKLYLPDNIDPGTVADELTVLSKYLTQFEPELLQVLATELDKFNWHNIRNSDRFAYDLQELRSNLLPLAENIKQRCFNLLGHAHLDMAWLWTITETKEVAQRTFESVFSLQQNFPALTFGHTSPALYQWIESDRPELFTKIQNAVGLNKWELLGGMWIEPETNLVSGESLIRQLLYGQQYYQEKFGDICKVAWLPDSFGFTWQLPQILKQCGIEYFVTGKLHWNDTTEFPHGCFWWESPDGTRLLTLMSPPNVTGVMDTNPITMTDYALDWETQTGLQDIFWLPGVGDHGGGPTRDMLEVAAKWHNSPFFPEIKFTKAIDYLNKISSSPSPPVSQFPIWKDELYLELHRGCYSVRAEQKKYNRYCERLLYEAELWSSLATLLCEDKFALQPLSPNISKILRKEGVCQEDWRRGCVALKDSQGRSPSDSASPPRSPELNSGACVAVLSAPLGQTLIEVAWKKVLFNQFHDILPGTSIPEVFVEANQDWEAAIAIGETLLSSALKAIASSIGLPNPPQADAKPLVVFNSLNWERSQEVTIEDKAIEDNDLSFWICDESGNRISLVNKQQGNKLTFFAQNIPAVGYRLYWLCWQKRAKLTEVIEDKCIDYQLLNTFLKVVINPQTGNIDSILDRRNEREILSGQGNKLEAFIDKGQYWDAWNIDPEYEQKRLPDPELDSIEWIQAGLTRGIRVIKKLNQSTFIQDYILEWNSPFLKIVNQVDWQETHVMVKVAFPLNLTSDYVTYEIPCGTITRTTRPQTPTEQAKWEVSVLNWADLTAESENYGVSLLNDCKHGYDAKPSQLRLTLLRSPLWPDPKSDRGIHHFTYAIYPHQNSWREAKTVQKGYEFNTPLQTILIEGDLVRQADSLPPVSQLLSLSADNLILMALKFSIEQELIMRCYEAQGEQCSLKIESDLNLKLDRVIDALERKTKSESENINNINLYKIMTYKLKLI